MLSRRAAGGRRRPCSPVTSVAPVYEANTQFSSGGSCDAAFTEAPVQQMFPARAVKQYRSVETPAMDRSVCAASKLRLCSTREAQDRAQLSRGVLAARHHDPEPVKHAAPAARAGLAQEVLADELRPAS